jgi:multidrug efflux pump subunit AcrB
MIGLTALLLVKVPKGFIPTEDNGRISISTEAAQDVSYEAMVRYQRQVGDILVKNPYVGMFSLSVGGGFSNANSTRMFVMLVDRDKRPSADLVGGPAAPRTERRARRPRFSPSPLRHPARRARLFFRLPVHPLRCQSA